MKTGFQTLKTVWRLKKFSYALVAALICVSEASAGAQECASFFSDRVRPIYATRSQVQSLYRKYPEVKVKIDEMVKKFENYDFSSKRKATIADLATGGELRGPSTHFIQNYASLDPLLQKAIVDVNNVLLDGPQFSVYLRQLLEDTAVYARRDWHNRVPDFNNDNLMLRNSSRRVRKIDYLKRGVIDNHSFLKVMMSRIRSRGETPTIIHKRGHTGNGSRTQDYPDFHAVPRRGPFFDLYFGKNSSHGQTVHMLQMDYVSKTVYDSTNGNPRLFWDYATDSVTEQKGAWLWDTMFDGFNSSPQHPEWLKPKVTSVIQIF